MAFSAKEMFRLFQLAKGVTNVVRLATHEADQFQTAKETLGQSGPYNPLQMTDQFYDTAFAYIWKEAVSKRLFEMGLPNNDMDIFSAMQATTPVMDAVKEIVMDSLQNGTPMNFDKIPKDLVANGMVDALLSGFTKKPYALDALGTGILKNAGMKERFMAKALDKGYEAISYLPGMSFLQEQDAKHYFDLAKDVIIQPSQNPMEADKFVTPTKVFEVLGNYSPEKAPEGFFDVATAGLWKNAVSSQLLSLGLPTDDKNILKEMTNTLPVFNMVQSLMLTSLTGGIPLDLSMIPTNLVPNGMVQAVLHPFTQKPYGMDALGNTVMRNVRANKKINMFNALFEVGGMARGLFESKPTAQQQFEEQMMNQVAQNIQGELIKEADGQWYVKEQLENPLQNGDTIFGYRQPTIEELVSANLGIKQVAKPDLSFAGPTFSQDGPKLKM